MERPCSTAFEAAKEITVAQIQNSDSLISDDTGECAAEFFEAVYNKLKKIAMDASMEEY